MLCVGIFLANEKSGLGVRVGEAIYFIRYVHSLESMFLLFCNI